LKASSVGSGGTTVSSRVDQGFRLEEKGLAPIMKWMRRISAVLCLCLVQGVTGATPPAVFASQRHADAPALSFQWRGIDPEPLRREGPVSFLYRATGPGSTLTLGFSITDSDGDVIARDNGISRPDGDGKVRWNAEYPDSSPVLPGLYQVRLTVTDRAGDSVRSSAKPFRVLTPTQSTVIRKVDGAGRRVALTFDDCYKEHAWSRLLRILSAHHVKATFFCLGTQVKRYPKLARRTVGQGNAIGSHGWDHHRTTTLPYRGIRSRLAKDERVWWETDRNTPAPYFRPPYGSYDAKTLRAAGDAGYARTILWDVDARDYRRPGASVIAHRVVSRARRGSIVEMNVLGQTAGALTRIIQGLRKHHLRPVTLPALFEAGGLH
jgi:peptidoglycan-N-acetylglucosamine deacetylase